MNHNTTSTLQESTNCPACNTPMRDELQESWRTKQTYHIYTCDNPECDKRGLTADNALLEELRNNPAKLAGYKKAQ